VACKSCLLKSKERKKAGGLFRARKGWVGRVRDIEVGESKLQQGAYQQGEPEKRPLNSELPPHRPDHDVQVQQLLRKQYHGHSRDGMPDPDKKG
jgi:hypothetical protein